MRVLPVSHLKGCARRPLQKIPKEGTKLKNLYDKFMNNKGLVIDHISDNCSGRKIDDLKNYYGLDIRNIKHGKWVLAGEWFGKIYVDYIADKIKE